MIISMKLHATKEEIEQVCERIRDFGYKIHSIEGEERVVIGVVGIGRCTACLESVEAMPGVEKAVRISAPYKFVSKEFRKERTRYSSGRLRDRRRRVHRDGGAVLGGIEKQIMEAAEGVARAGAKIAARRSIQTAHFALRFSGHGRRRPEAARQGQGARPGSRIITEVMSDRDVDLVADYADVLQIGARNMQNFALLKTAGQMRPAGPAEARHEFHDQGTADVGRVRGGARQPERDSMRARHPDVRNGDAQHLRHRGRGRAQ